MIVAVSLCSSFLVSFLALPAPAEVPEATERSVSSAMPVGPESPEIPTSPEAAWVRGMTISCQTYGPEWGTDGFAAELDELQSLGVNWIAIHPYAGLSADGTVRSRLDPEDPPRWLTRPLEETRARGMSLFVKPHLAYWGSPFSWRGEIEFPDPQARARFERSYHRWIVDLARIYPDVEAFCVGTELDLMVEDARPWRELIAEVRQLTSAHLTYAANWDAVERVSFWEQLDAIGVQAYFPLVPAEDTPLDAQSLSRGLDAPLSHLSQLHARTGKPVIFTELGYDASPLAALRPWESRPREAPLDYALQQRCLSVALERLHAERAWLRGAFLWKWFVGPTRGEDYPLDRPQVRQLLQQAWQR